MSGEKRHPRGRLRRSQVITTWGPEALLDLPRDSVIVGGLETWPPENKLEEIREPRLAQKAKRRTKGGGPIRFYAPPDAVDGTHRTAPGIIGYRFPQWFVVQGEEKAKDAWKRSRRLLGWSRLENGKFGKSPVVPTRFVQACPRGHVADLDWHAFVHQGNSCSFLGELWLDEAGAGGDLADLSVRCACGKSRRLNEAAGRDANALGICPGKRPWLGPNSDEDCDQPSSLLIRTATNSWFPQIVRSLSLPAVGKPVEQAVETVWDLLRFVENDADLRSYRKNPAVSEKIEGFGDSDILQAILRRKEGTPQPPLKQAELAAILAAPEGGGSVPRADRDFDAVRLGPQAWKSDLVGSDLGGIGVVVQLHRLREVAALVGFTRFEAALPDIHGEYHGDVERAPLALSTSWLPAVENRGEGVFVELDRAALSKWSKRTAVKKRVAALAAGHGAGAEQSGVKSPPPFPGGTYVLLHTLSHLLIRSVAFRCGYPASSIRERIYVEEAGVGILLYTASSDAEGTLGGLVQQGRRLDEHLDRAIRSATLCSNDPVCSEHEPGADSLEERWRHGAACHACALAPETSCEMRNEYLDRALVVPILGERDAAFFADED